MVRIFHSNTTLDHHMMNPFLNRDNRKLCNLAAHYVEDSESDNSSSTTHLLFISLTQRPFWLSPRQCLIAPVSEKFADYAKEVQQTLWDAGYYADLDGSDHTLQKKIRDAQIAQYNFILVVGEKEVENKVVNVRTRDNVVHGERSLSALMDEFTALCKEYK